MNTAAIILWMFVIFGFTCLGFFLFSINKTNKRLKEERSPEFARKMRWNASITPFRGCTAVVLGPSRWVIVNWDKGEGFLDIVMPPQERLDNEDKIHTYNLNWKITREIAPKKVTVDEYFSRTRIM